MFTNLNSVIDARYGSVKFKIYNAILGSAL